MKLVNAYVTQADLQIEYEPADIITLPFPLYKLYLKMSSHQPDRTKPHGLIVSPSTGLMKLPAGSSPALSEIISRSLLHIQTRAESVVPARKAGDECEFEIATGVKIVMCWIPPGEFLMGSPEDEKDRYDKETQHRVKITQGYWLAKTQTTQAQWNAVMGSSPSYFKGEDLPVEHVSWKDICGDEGCSEGFLESANRIRSGDEYFHLPTEAQWEYACRAGTAGADAGDLDEIAWYRENNDGMTHPVGQKKANAWGLHDMIGNVFEWCSDWYGDYDGREATNPVGPARGSYRVVRGCDWTRSAFQCRAAFRGVNHRIPPRRGPNCQGPIFLNYFGFRLARSSVPSAAKCKANGA